jgi:hypothetical protein
LELAPYLIALAITQLVEAPIYAALLGRFADVRLAHAAAGSVGVNCVSHPLFSFVLLGLLARWVPLLAAVMLSELIVCAVEAALLTLWLRRDPFTVLAASLAANGASLAAGVTIFSVLAR